MASSLTNAVNSAEDKYDVGTGEQFEDLVGLIEHLRSYPTVENSGEVLHLLHPVGGTSLRVHDLDQKVEDMEELQKSENKSSLDEEFNSLNLEEEMSVFTVVEGTKTENMVKNRYRNILPYDHTRVVLRNLSDGPQETDYVNANYIRSPTRSESSSVQSSNESLNSVKSLTLQSDCRRSPPLVSKSLSEEALREIKKCMKLDKINGNFHRHTVKDKTYIATQGCLLTTVNDFWHMIWQEDVRVIAMITNETERGKKKCDRYWPLSGQTERYLNLVVKCLSETCYEEYCLRELQIDDEEARRIVYHYQFTAWPDHGTPPEPDGVLTFLDDINRRMYQNTLEINPPEQNMLCVHCSAGVGRTGTFIVLDMLIDKIKKFGFNCDIDVHNTVKMVRTQRRGMVQNKAQYRFIYLALQSYIDKKNLQWRKKVYTSEA